MLCRGESADHFGARHIHVRPYSAAHPYTKQWMKVVRKRPRGGSSRTAMVTSWVAGTSPWNATEVLPRQGSEMVTGFVCPVEITTTPTSPSATDVTWLDRSRC